MDFRIFHLKLCFVLFLLFLVDGYLELSLYSHVNIVHTFNLNTPVKTIDRLLYCNFKQACSV